MGLRRVVAFSAATVLTVSLTACTKSAGSPSGDSSETTSPAVDADSARKRSADMVAHCLSGAPVTGRSVRVATTVAPITSLVASVVGETGAEITGIVPEGTNSHTFEPPPGAARALENADVIFANGLKLEDPTLDLATKVAPKAVICEIGTAVLPENEWIYDFSFPASAGKPNPHIWTSPPYALKIASLVRDVMVHLDPAHADALNANYAKSSAVYSALDDAMKTATETIPADQRKLLTYHDAYAYFAKHYGYTVIGAIQPSSFEEPSPKDVAALVKQVESQKVKAIFGSEVFPSPVLEQIGKETGARYVDTLRDDDLPGAPGAPDHSWVGLMRFDFVTMVSALGGDAKALSALDINHGVPDRAVYPQ